MKCPKCDKVTKALVLETRKNAVGEIYRRRACGHCGKNFTTKEVITTEPVPDIRVAKAVDRRSNNSLKFGTAKHLQDIWK